MKSPHLKKIAIPFLAIGLLFPAKDISNSIIFTARGLDLYNVQAGKDARGREVFSLAGISYRDNSIPSITDLVLSFNTAASGLVKDDTRKYTIHSASYEPVKDKGSLGGGAASFFKNGHGVEIETSRELWLGRCEDLGSFTIEMRLFPQSLREGGVLFSNVSYSAGKKTGIEILIKGGRVVTRLFRLFRDADGRRTDVFLNRGRPLTEGRWYHYSLSFDRITGKLAAYTDGEDDEVVYASADGEPCNGVFEPSFGCEDLPVAYLGRNFYGYLDEVRISYRTFENLKKETALALKAYENAETIGRTPVNREGVITSPVYAFPLTGTRVIEFAWEEALKKDTFVWMEFRILDDLFDPGGGAPRWYRVVNNQRNIYLKKTDDLFLRGKYYQWRAHLLPSPDGRNSPVMWNIGLHYQLDPAPRPPLFLESPGVADSSFTLRWKKNVEHDILGYRVYYGTNPKKYDGIIQMIGGRRISNEMNKNRTSIEVVISGDVIEENRASDDRKLLNYPILKNNVLYYVAVSAYDSYRPGTPYNHESELSGEITVRPFAGSEINQ